MAITAATHGIDHTVFKPSLRSTKNFGASTFLTYLGSTIGNRRYAPTAKKIVVTAKVRRPPIAITESPPIPGPTIDASFTTMPLATFPAGNFSVGKIVGMIAAAAGNHEIASLLLAEGADPTHGECPPLALAGKKGDAPIIKLLLAHQAQLKFSKNDEYAFLAIALENGASLECLRLITPHHCFACDDGTTNSPLGLAIKTQQASSVALLLASGSPIEKFNAEKNTLWDEAFINGKKPWELLDLLVTTCPLCNFSSADYSKENYLINFFENCENPIPLATQGFYPSVVDSSRDELQRLHANELSLAKMEKQN